MSSALIAELQLTYFSGSDNKVYISIDVFSKYSRSKLLSVSVKALRKLVSIGWLLLIQTARKDQPFAWFGLSLFGSICSLQGD